jgi:hypothetical protein
MAKPTTRRTLASTGKNIDAAFDHEEERQEQKAQERAAGLDKIFRFGIQPGEQAEIVLLDEDYHDGVAFYEHNLRDSKGHFSVYRPCVSEVASCACCENTDSKPYFILYLSVLHLNAYQDKKTKQWRNSRALLGIKSVSAPTFKKVMSAAMKKHGTLRGVTLLLQRPKGAATSSARIGEPVEYEETGTRFDFVKNIEKEFGHDAIKAKDGTVFKEANVDITPFDYEVLFPLAFDVDAAITTLNKEFGGGKNAAGSADEVAKAWEEDEDDDIDMTSVRPSSRKRFTKADEIEEEEEEEEEEKPSRPARSRNVKSDDDEEEKPSRPSRSRIVKAYDEDSNEKKAPAKKAASKKSSDDDGW